MNPFNLLVWLLNFRNIVVDNITRVHFLKLQEFNNLKSNQTCELLIKNLQIFLEFDNKSNYIIYDTYNMYIILYLKKTF